MAMKTSGVQFKMKRFFFNSKEVERILGKRSAKALGRAGAFVQRRARSSLRRRKKSSAPGSPPSVHSSDAVATLKNIWFALDPRSLSVVVGPLQYAGKSLESNSQGTGAALHEFGGRGKFRQRNKSRKPRPVRVASFPARPFMFPALEKEAPNFPSLWLQRAG